MRKSVAIVDADLIGRRGHRFPNLACMKISGYFKQQGCKVDLVTDYQALDLYQDVYISKVFTDTLIPKGVDLSRYHTGGSGFMFDKAEPLPDKVEHCKPDYHLYDEWLKDKPKTTAYKEYRDYSIGFTTRGCFRGCGFCINKNYRRVKKHSPVEEFLEESRPKICLLDDNILGFEGWQAVWESLQGTGKPFKYKQGLDERLLTKHKCSVIFKSRYDGQYTFAFDNVKDYELIRSKLELIRQHTDSKAITFYVLCGYESTGIEDIIGTFQRIDLLKKYKCLPYIMRYQSPKEKPYMQSKYKDVYITLARWCNQPSFFRKTSFIEYVQINQRDIKTPGKQCTALRALKSIEGKVPQYYLESRWSSNDK